MKLHRIRLKNFRGVRESDIEFAERGVTIVEGPNEIGKTSIPEAFGLAIDYADNTTSKRVKSIRPVDRDEGTEVEFELSTGRYRLVFKKRWFRKRGTTLTVMTPQNENHSGREAHNRLNEILAETPNEDLRKALQIEQGKELKLPGFKNVSSIGRALENAAGGEIADSEEDTIMDRIREEYVRFWTLERGSVKKWRLESAKRVEEAESKAVDRKKRMEEVENDVSETVRLADESRGIERTLRELGESEERLTEEWAGVEGLRTDLDRVEAVHVAAESRRQQAVQEWGRREELKKDRDARVKELSDLEAESERVSPALFAATGQSEEAATFLKAAADELRDARKRQDIAFGDRDFRQDEIDSQLISERLKRYQEANVLLKSSEEYLASAKVDEKALADIERAYQDDVRAQAAVESAAATVEATALSDVTLEVGGSKIRLGTNDTRSIIVEDQAEIVVPDVARFRVSAAPEAKVLAERRRSANDSYLRLCQSFGVADREEARRAERERRDALRNREQAQSAMARELRDWTAEFMASRLASLNANVSAYPQQRPEHPPMPADLDEARRIASETAAAVADRERDVQAREEAWKETELYLNKVKVEQAELAAKVDLARSQRQEASERLESAREVLSDEELLVARDGAQHSYDASLKAFEEVKGRFRDADPDSIRARLDNVGDAKRRFEIQQQTNRRRQDELRGKLDAMGEEGIHGALEEAQGRLEQIRREHDGMEARAEAARLLWETFDGHRRRAHQRYVGPFKEEIDRLGRIVFGSTFEVELDAEKLEVARRTVEGVTLDVEQLSTGAREQLGVLSRLACAAIVSPEDGGAPVMIDDALGWSDPQRLQSMGAAINAAGKQCQIVILTCYPGRYSHVGNAKVVRL